MTLFGTADYCTGTVPAAFECNATGKGLVDGALRNLSMDLSYDKVLFHSLPGVFGDQIANFSGHLEQEYLLIWAENTEHIQNQTNITFDYCNVKIRLNHVDK